MEKDGLPEIFKKFELIRNEIIYDDKEGELRGWEQPNNCIVLYAGESGTKYEEEYPQEIQFPKEAIPSLISFLEKVKIPCLEGRRLFNISWRAPAEKHGLLYADYLEHIATCKECISAMKFTDRDIQVLKRDAEGYRRGANELEAIRKKENE